MNRIWSGAALALALPGTVAAQGAAAPPDIAALSRCAAVYDLMSEMTEEGSEGKSFTSYRFLQFYVLLRYTAEIDAADAITPASTEAMFNADAAKIKTEFDALIASGKTEELFAADMAACDTIRANNVEVFDLVDKKIEELQKASS